LIELDNDNYCSINEELTKKIKEEKNHSNIDFHAIENNYNNALKAENKTCFVELFSGVGVIALGGGSLNGHDMT
jgi:hypothetical protein